MPNEFNADNFGAYEDGKHRRYSLLFAVNGGAFAIAKLLVGAEKNEKLVVGHLNLRQLSLGMVLFTLLMVFDIYVFGEKMRGNRAKLGPVPNAFAWQGKLVLLFIGCLICAGWVLAGLG